MKVALRGNSMKPGKVAPRRFLRIVAGKDREHFNQGSGREQLAKAVVDPTNPLTARVFVNRVWQHHLGAGAGALAGQFRRAWPRANTP